MIMRMKKKILYIDDEEINIQLFKINFQSKYDVITGFSGSDGLSCLETHPDIMVVLSDMKMPKMNGLEFIAKAREKYIDQKYFILTGFDITEEIKMAIETGLILKYFRKPFKVKEIMDAIEEVI
jgi:two-component system response regulator (stage 0 sporulation protein F)